MKRQLQCSAAAVLTLALAGQAQAAGTTAGTTVSNTATINYAVGGVSQTAVNSNSATFLVDRRVNLSVAELGSGATQAAPGATTRVTTFTVTNTTNAALDFRLVATQDANGGALPFSGTDNFDMGNVAIYVDANGNGTYEPATDTATFLDELAADATRSVFVVADVPAGRADGDKAGVTLTAVAAAPGTSGTLGADAVETSGADSAMVVDTVFGDGMGDTDVARDGKHSDDDQYNVTSANVTLLKSSKVISDPFNGSTNPKAIPGAVMEYCIQVQNTGSTSADSVAVTDPIPTNTTFVSGSIRANGTVTTGTCNADGSIEDDDNAGSDESDPAGGNLTGSTITATLPSVAASATRTVRFQVTVN